MAYMEIDLKNVFICDKKYSSVPSFLRSQRQKSHIYFHLESLVCSG